MIQVRRHGPAARMAFVTLGVVFLMTASGCGSSGITPPPLQASISTTFSNLYVLQQIEQGNPRPDVGALRTHAACQKGTPATNQSGAGDDWLCEITYLVAGPQTPVTARYNVSVQTDGCYAADGDGPASVNGSRTITGPHFQPLLNPLWLIDGCFDVT
jgi:ABC-2 type transport system permease protein